MAWTDDRVDTLKQLWAEGLSASQIATKMGGVTRNAVIGKVHRLGLSGRAAPSKPKAAVIADVKEENLVDLSKIAEAKAVKSSGRKKAIAQVASKIKSKPKRKIETSLDDLNYAEPLMLDSGELTTIPTLKTGMCKWPVGDPSSEEFHFCGQESESGKPYCTYHANLAFQPNTATKRETVSTRRQIAAPRKQAG